MCAQLVLLFALLSCLYAQQTGDLTELLAQAKRYEDPQDPFKHDRNTEGWTVHVELFSATASPSACFRQCAEDCFFLAPCADAAQKSRMDDGSSKFQVALTVLDRDRKPISMSSLDPPHMRLAIVHGREAELIYVSLLNIANAKAVEPVKVSAAAAAIEESPATEKARHDATDQLEMQPNVLWVTEAFDLPFVGEYLTRVDFQLRSDVDPDEAGPAQKPHHHAVTRFRLTEKDGELQEAPARQPWDGPGLRKLVLSTSLSADRTPVLRKAIELGEWDEEEKKMTPPQSLFGDGDAPDDADPSAVAVDPTARSAAEERLTAELAAGHMFEVQFGGALTDLVAVHTSLCALLPFTVWRPDSADAVSQDPLGDDALLQPFNGGAFTVLAVPHDSAASPVMLATSGYRDIKMATTAFKDVIDCPTAGEQVEEGPFGPRAAALLQFPLKGVWTVIAQFAYSDESGDGDDLTDRLVTAVFDVDVVDYDAAKPVPLLESNADNLRDFLDLEGTPNPLVLDQPVEFVQGHSEVLLSVDLSSLCEAAPTAAKRQLNPADHRHGQQHQSTAEGDVNDVGQEQSDSTSDGSHQLRCPVVEMCSLDVVVHHPVHGDVPPALLNAIRLQIAAGDEPPSQRSRSSHARAASVPPWRMRAMKFFVRASVPSFALDVYKAAQSALDPLERPADGKEPPALRATLRIQLTKVRRLTSGHAARVLFDDREVEIEAPYRPQFFLFEPSAVLRSRYLAPGNQGKPPISLDWSSGWRDRVPLASDQLNRCLGLPETVSDTAEPGAEGAVHLPALDAPRRMRCLADYLKALQRDTLGTALPACVAEGWRAKHFVPDCRWLARQVGADAMEGLKMDGEAFASCPAQPSVMLPHGDPVCFEGCQHGAVAAWVDRVLAFADIGDADNEKGVTQLIQDIPEICSAVAVPAVCWEGIGHGLVQSAFDVARSFALCDRLSAAVGDNSPGNAAPSLAPGADDLAPDAHECKLGVIEEHIDQLTIQSVADPAPEPADLARQACQPVVEADAQYGDDCARLLGRYFLLASNGDAGQAVVVCRPISGDAFGAPGFADQCGIGVQLAAREIDSAGDQPGELWCAAVERFRSRIALTVFSEGCGQQEPNCVQWLELDEDWIDWDPQAVSDKPLHLHASEQPGWDQENNSRRKKRRPAANQAPNQVGDLAITAVPDHWRSDAPAKIMFYVVYEPRGSRMQLNLTLMDSIATASPTAAPPPPPPGPPATAVWYFEHKPKKLSGVFLSNGALLWADYPIYFLTGGIVMFILCCTFLTCWIRICCCQQGNPSRFNKDDSLLA